MNIRTVILVMGAIFVANVSCLGGVSRIWDGGGTTALASNPTNWVGDIAPASGDLVVLDATSSKNMTWDLNIPVQSWYQVNYVGTVTVATVYGAVGFTNLAILGDCTISNGAWTQTINPTGNNESNRLNVMIGGNLFVGSNAAVDVTGKGYSAGYGPGYGGTYLVSHGGRGRDFTGALAPCYGSIVAPTNLGSGGLITYGGGAVILNVGGDLRNEGLISANGEATAAGGSIFLKAGRITGTGTIRANGGDKGYAPGGGGRISLVITNTGADFSGYTGLITAYSGGNAGNAGYAGAGTIYKQSAADGVGGGTLIVDDYAHSFSTPNNPGYTDISSNVTGTVVGTVLIRNSASLRLITNQTLTVSGIWSNGAGFVSQWGSQVIFAGGVASTSTVYGSTPFMGFTCTNTNGKTIIFEAGKTNTIPAQGRLTLKGSATTTNLVLRSTSDTTPWKLNVNALADQSVMYVDASNCDARAGVSVVALNSLDRGANTNWVFMAAGVGETNTWTGAGNTVWSLSTNWSLARPPLADDYIVIPSAMPRYPVLDNHRTVNGIEIQASAALSLNNYNLTVTRAAKVAGAITASGSEVITLLADADFTGGSITAARSELALAGGAAQTINPGNLTFYKINVVNSNVTFSSGFTTFQLRCDAPSGTRQIVFQAGSTYVVSGSLLLQGASATTNIMLRSSSPGSSWNLTAMGYRSVQGVDVADSHAGGGFSITATSSLNSGNNVNWDFSPVWAIWQGTSGTNFHLASNWSPAGVPGAGTRVVVNSANAMSITGAVTLLDLTVGGGAVASTATVNSALTVLENIYVLSNGTLILNRPCGVSNSLYVFQSGVMTHSANSTAEVNKLTLTINGDLTVSDGAVIDVTGKGYAPQKGPGGAAVSDSGGTYGGHGTGGAAPCYGSIIAPTNLGSGGWYNNSLGGGAVLLTVAGTANNDGLIRADGTELTYDGGAGGTVYLVAGVLGGRGTIQANGAINTGGSYGQGGGGRVAVQLTQAGASFSNFTGSIRAVSGNKVVAGIGYGANSSGAGTVYLRTAAQGPNDGTLILDNESLGSTGYTYIHSNVTDAVVGNLLIRNGAKLMLPTNQIITVSGVWSNGASFTAQLGSQVIFSGGLSSTSTLYGTSTFMGLTCTNEGKTLVFPTNVTTGIAAGGILNWHGSAAATNLFLRSIIPGQVWKLNISASAQQSILNVDVQDSDASAGAEAMAFNSMNSGRNTNWSFSGISTDTTNVWTGAGSRIWSAGANWSFARAPLSTDSVRIPTGLARYPVLDSARTVTDLALEAADASLALNGYDLTVSGKATIAGGLVCTGSETVAFCGDVDFTGGAFTPASSKVLLTGNVAQVVSPANLTFYKLVVVNTNVVTFENGFSAYELRCEPTGSERRNLVFKDAETVSLNLLTLLSPIGTTNIIVSSLSPGDPWLLNVSGHHSVRGVDVSDSEASAGQMIYASGSGDGGNNTHWTFDGNWAEWTGQTGNGQFGSLSNWWPMAVPGVNSRVRIDSANAMTITGAVSVLGLTVGGGSGGAIATVNAAMTVMEDITVLSNGVLVINRPCVVSNVYVLAGGLLTHTTNTEAEINKLNLTVSGNLIVAAGGSIDVSGKGYGGTKGPGYGGTYLVSHGGRGREPVGSLGPCYGSIIAPTNLGSGGMLTYECWGGGAVILNVGGSIQNDGVISADGGSTDGSGGSIFLTAGEMTGSGTIRANGAPQNHYAPAGGGRVSLTVTNAGADFSGYSGLITAGSGPFGYSGYAGAGTVYKQSAADRPGRGSVWVDNQGKSGGYTEVPPSTNYVAGEMARATFYVTNAARLRLVNDCEVGDIWVPSANAMLDLNFRTLIVHSRQHAFSGTVTNFGSIIWIPDVAGTVFSIR